MYSYLNPGAWLSFLHGLPRESAVIVFVVALSTLVLGSRGFRYYLCLLVGGAGWWGGMLLAKLMHVVAWYMALPTALLAMGVMWPVATVAAPVLEGIAVGCAVGTVGMKAGGPAAFWPALALGFFAGVAVGVVAPRFAATMFWAASGTGAVIATLGAVVRSSSGWLAPGAYLQYPVPFAVAGAMVFVASVVVQVVLQVDAPVLGIQDRAKP